MTSLLEKLSARRHGCLNPSRIAAPACSLNRIEDEARWQDCFERSQDRLAALADVARKEIARG
jgi:hypothetical protein